MSELRKRPGDGLELGGTVARSVAAAQGVYFSITGIWPLIDIDSFETVTGPKTDDWLVRTVGALVTAVALPILIAAYRGTIALELLVLAVGSAFALLVIDLVFVAIGRISPVYLVDAAAEAVLLAGWAAACLVDFRRHSGDR